MLNKKKTTFALKTKKTKVRTIPDIFTTSGFTDPNIINQAETSHEGGLHFKEFKNLWALSDDSGAGKTCLLTADKTLIRKHEASENTENVCEETTESSAWETKVGGGVPLVEV